MQLSDYIEKSHDLKIVKSKPLATGFGVEGHKIWLDDGRVGAVKFNFSKPKDKPSDEFRLEAFMLATLGNSGWPVPEIWASDEHCLVMQWLENDGNRLEASAEFTVGQNLAELHGCRGDPRARFGFDRPTPIGPIAQPNTECATWIAFFKERRLMHMASLAKANGRLPEEMFDRLELLAQKLGDYLAEPEHPSLIHGDIWGGNVIVNEGQLVGYIDPAIYYAHFEIELAFTQMFGTFGPEFFKGYESITPLDPAFFEVRLEIYNLYPTLVHVNLFGSSYLAPIENTLSRFGF